MDNKGGIRILRDKRVWNGELLKVGRQCISGRFTRVNEDSGCHITTVYVDCNREIRKVLWEELIRVKNRVDGPWTICGDFNELEMIVPPLFGRSFTWRRGKDHTCASRINKSYFKIESWWLKVEGFKEKVKAWWCSFVVEGRASYIVDEKLKCLKVRLKEWSKNNRGN
ncbi:hypothetical protein H5410_037148 [Solanum commersonii]|uniref:Endonuclease/exonuclease/phosphatase domain-containing protein n=1 Tax=Solanum commersonii TaxID=4109 RepID=A0A9J5Y9E5_SOLCO|nr:hypothetical protein H5410_037148 [Solanum commersonii]